MAPLASKTSHILIEIWRFEDSLDLIISAVNCLPIKTLYLNYLSFVIALVCLSSLGRCRIYRKFVHNESGPTTDRAYGFSKQSVAFGPFEMGQPWIQQNHSSSSDWSASWQKYDWLISGQTLIGWNFDTVLMWRDEMGFFIAVTLVSHTQMGKGLSSYYILTPLNEENW